MSGWIKMHRKIKEWEWFTEPNVYHVFSYLLFTVTHKEIKIKGKILKPGQYFLSYDKIAVDTGLTRQKVRTAIDKLISTNEIKVTSTSQKTLFTVVKWDLYQQDEKISTNDITNDITNEQPTSNQPTNNNEKKSKEKEKIYSVFFDSVWKLYPSKIGKEAVSLKSQKEIESAGYEIIKSCIEKYCYDKPDWQNYMNGSTFFNGRWKEFMNQESEPKKTQNITVY